MTDRTDTARSLGTASTSTWLRWDESRQASYVRVQVQPGRTRRVVALSVEEILALDGDGEAEGPVALNGLQWDADWNPETGTYGVSVGVLPGSASCVQVGVRYEVVASAASGRRPA